METEHGIPRSALGLQGKALGLLYGSNSKF